MSSSGMLDGGKGERETEGKERGSEREAGKGEREKER
jgi:hypothetical protein